MERQYSMPPVSLTNLLVGPPPITSPLASQATASFDQQLDDDDIYRGPDPRTPVVGNPTPTIPSFTQSAASISSSSSSSSSSSGGIGFNIIPSVIEHAIARWARGKGLRRRNSSSSDSSSSFSSSTSSRSSTKTNPRRRRKRSPSLLSHTTSLTTRRQARAASRSAPREFILFLPPQLDLPSVTFPDQTNEEKTKYHRRELRTSSLKLIGAQLGLAMKRNARTQRPLRQGQQPAKFSEEPGTAAFLPTVSASQSERGRKRKANEPHVLFDLPPSSDLHPSSLKEGTGLKKGKGRVREVPRQFFLQEAPYASTVPELGQKQQPAWWLDVASPTWDDMRALGKLLQLHPLTLEDILHKESREKFEFFPRLGYYFVVFRAIDTSQPELPVRDDSSYSSENGLELSDVIDITNVYLVVFKEGICTFHFEDISPHLDTVRKRVLQLEETLPMTSDWIAHGLMDSIVDAFFPVTNDIQKEVSMVEDFVSGIDEWEDGEKTPLDSSPSPRIAISDDGGLSSKSSATDEKKQTEDSHTGLLNPHQLMPKRNWHDFLSRFWIKRRKGKRTKSMLSKHLAFLRRMTTTRRLVTTLGRLLSSKSEVVAQIRKRLNGNGEVAIYLGDVQDHIISLHQLLADHERMLSQSHPAYLSHLKLSLSQAKDGLDQGLLLLSLVSLLTLCTQSITSLGGMNVHVPRNDQNYTFFWVFLGVASALGAAALGVARYWYIQAHGGRPKMEEL